MQYVKCDCINYSCPCCLYSFISPADPCVLLNLQLLKALRPQAWDSDTRKSSCLRGKGYEKDMVTEMTNMQFLETGFFRIKANSANSMIMIILTMTITTALNYNLPEITTIYIAYGTYLLRHFHIHVLIKSGLYYRYYFVTHLFQLTISQHFSMSKLEIKGLYRYVNIYSNSPLSLNI